MRISSILGSRSKTKDAIVVSTWRGLAGAEVQSKALGVLADLIYVPALSYAREHGRLMREQMRLRREMGEMSFRGVAAWANPPLGTWVEKHSYLGGAVE